MTVLPMFPLEHPLLPVEPLSLNVFEPRYRRMVSDVLAGDGRFGVVLIARGSEVGGGDERFGVGTVVQLIGHRLQASGQIRLACRGIERLRVVSWLDDDPYPRAEIELWPDEPAGGPAEWARARVPFTSVLAETQDLYDQMAARSGRPAVVLGAPDDLPPTDYTFRTAANLPLGAADRYDVLRAPGPRERLDAMIRALDDVLPILRDRLAPQS
ncbi:LON peptidase substrate-binding domain-containing protein [Gordonia sp. (in: high G+C Gram-positive bacteria)]|uniref:LON peptidase substrate-binding domain-containing protein n=1 Tax=Gordonia sp. (in: high G+C Gram-positive bacteria) TaxID=84139 RepID=UPI00261C1A2E|nr:LON peptidase substrate-binding domain-containing protein [Gordonia sp. (in: high G+C Gram-positive bacteria)]